jgi:hypothetical protein
MFNLLSFWGSKKFDTHHIVNCAYPLDYHCTRQNHHEPSKQRVESVSRA